jgi:hypothetical protein
MRQEPTHAKLQMLTIACVEAATGVCLFLLPSFVFAILPGLEHPSIETIFFGRLTRAALLAAGVASGVWRLLASIRFA